jgi:hypothetical protein
VEHLAALTNLHVLDLSENPVCNTEGYSLKVFEMLTGLQVLDGKNKEGQSVGMGDMEDYGEEGEFEQEQMKETSDNLGPDTRKKFENGELSVEDLKGLGLLADSYGSEDFMDEQGEEEQSEEGGEKRAKTDE